MHSGSREGAASAQPHGWEGFPWTPALSTPESDARALNPPSPPTSQQSSASCPALELGSPAGEVPVLIHKPPLLVELCGLVRTALPSVLVPGVPLSLEGGGGDAEEQRGKGEWTDQQQGHKRAVASQTTAEEEDGDDDEAAEEDGEEGLFQNSHRRLGCRFRCR